MSFWLKILKFPRRCPLPRFYSSDGDSGNIRDAGGKWKEREAAFEEQHFRQKDQEALERLKRQMKKKKKKRKHKKRRDEDDDGCERDRDCKD